jgi:hypothetical protein
MCVAVVSLRLYSIHDLWYETVAAVLSVVLTAAVTFLLLKGQSEGEERRDKNIKLHERKLEVYTQFTYKMWDILSDDNINAEEIKILRSEMFNGLLFFLDNHQIEQIDDALKELISDKELNSDDCRKSFTKITEILRCDINNTPYEEHKITAASSLWSTCSTLYDAVIDGDRLANTATSAALISDPQSESTEESSIVGRVSKRCHHFAIFKFDNWQKQLFENKVNALVLCEYNGETQRTNAIKRIKSNELVFAYQTGGQGYVGAFLAKGWVVFEQNDNGIVKEVKYEYDCNEQPRVVEGAEFQADLDRFIAADILNEKGGVRFSFLLVEPLCVYGRGVGRISVYRSTISTYDQRYAWQTLARFYYMYEHQKYDYGTYEGVQVDCNTAAFERLLKDEAVSVACYANNEWRD